MVELTKNSGQATVEYIFVLAVVVLLAFEITRRTSTFFQDQLGRVGHVLSTHLVIGVCQENCFFSNYHNGYGQ